MRAQSTVLLHFRIEQPAQQLLAQLSALGEVPHVVALVRVVVQIIELSVAALMVGDQFVAACDWRPLHERAFGGPELDHSLLTCMLAGLDPASQLVNPLLARRLLHARRAQEGGPNVQKALHR